MLAAQVVAHRCRAVCKGRVLRASNNDCKAGIEAMLKGQITLAIEQDSMTGAMTKLYKPHHSADKASTHSSTTSSNASLRQSTCRAEKHGTGACSVNHCSFR